MYIVYLRSVGCSPKHATDSLRTTSPRLGSVNPMPRAQARRAALLQIDGLVVPVVIELGAPYFV
jgi:hypothetical protein